MLHLFADPADMQDGLLTITGSEVNHIRNVLRMKPGDELDVSNGTDAKEYRYGIEMMDAEKIVCRLRFVKDSDVELPVKVYLFQGIPKSDKMDLIVQKAVELGVTRIVPVLMERCVSRPDPKDSVRKLERWRKIAREACKQSGRCIIPDVSDILSVKNIILDPQLPGVNIVPWENADSCGPLAFSNSHPDLSSVGILIGPEGGIDQAEIDFLCNSGFIPVTLGKRILRTETAGLAAISAIMCLYGEMD